MSEPRDASSIILINEDRVLLAQRNPKLSFLGGWHAFAGGKLDAFDCDIKVKNCQEPELERFIVCAVRELFEEVGVLLVRNGDKLTRGQRESLHDDLISERSSFKEILDDWGLWIDAADLSYTGFWTTPKFSPVRFKTRFFIAKCPPKQTPYAAISELRNIEFIRPADALQLWETGEILISPPVLISLRELAENEHQKPGDAERKSQENIRTQTSSTDTSLSDTRQPALSVENLLRRSERCNGTIDHLELNSRHLVIPLKTPTLPPATHTNCFIVGKKKFIVIDAASGATDEQAKLHRLIDELLDRGGICQEIVVSHLHRDHHGGETALQQHLRSRGLEVPISTHRLTAEELTHIRFDRHLEDGDIYELMDEKGDVFQLETLHTRGHARGLLNFYDREIGLLISTDNVVGLGTVVIAPPEGDMRDYLNTLERLRDLPDLKHLCGSHGTAIFDAKAKIGEYISHRREREKQIVEAVRQGARTPAEIVEKVYVGLKHELLPLAVKSVESHLAKLEADRIL